MRMKLTTKGKVAILILILIIIGIAAFFGIKKGLIDLGGIKDTVSNITSSDKDTSNTSNKTKSDGNTINLSYDEWAGWKVIVDAKANGYYDDEGINVNLSVINDATDSSNALIKGDLDAAGYTVNRYAFLMDKFKSNDVEVVMPYIVNYSAGGDGIIAKSGIDSIEDLVGKKIGVPRYSEAQTLVKWFLNKSNLTDEQKKQIEFVYFNDPDETANAFFAGELDAAATWQPYLTQAEESTDSKILVDTKNATNLILDGIVFRKDFVDNNPETVEKFIRATLRAIDDYDKDYTALKNNMQMFATMSDESIKETLADAKLATYNDNIKLLTDEAKILFEDMSNIWIELGEKAYPEMEDSAFDSTIISKLEDEFKTVEEKPVMVTEEQKNEVLSNEDYNALLNKQVSIEFKANSAVFANQEQAIASLDEFVDIAKMLNGSIIKVEGNLANVSGATTSSEEDIKLTEQRARTVANYLISKGIDASRFVIVGNGINNQIADNSTEEGRRQNRRTDIKFLLLE